MGDRKVLQSVVFEPSDSLIFEGKLEHTHQKSVIMTNWSNVIVSFKCKGTSPKQIKIRPGYGYLKPADRATITLHVMPLNTRPRPPTKERLVVLLAVAPPNCPPNPTHMWRGGSIPKDPRRFVLPLKFPGATAKNSTKVIPQTTKIAPQSKQEPVQQPKVIPQAPKDKATENTTSSDSTTPASV